MSAFSCSKVMQYVSQRNVDACVAWLQMAKLEDSQFQTAVEIARKGFPGPARSHS